MRGGGEVDVPKSHPAMKLTRGRIEENLEQYLKERDDAKGTARFYSFDYCYNYFRSFYKRGELENLRSPEYLQTSCLQIGFYLASWGMFRGPSHLSKRSMKHYEPLVDVIVEAEGLFELDVSVYNAESIETILSGFTQGPEIVRSSRHPNTGHQGHAGCVRLCSSLRQQL